MVDNPWIPILAVTLYGVGIVLGKQYFANRPAWNWRNTMALWNFSLSVFSALGFVRTLPQLLHNLFSYTLTENLCLDPESHYGSGGTGFWVQVFCLSKFPYVPILDTVLICVEMITSLLMSRVLHMLFVALFMSIPYLVG